MHLLRRLLVALVSAALIALPSLALADEGPQWEATSDTGSLGDDVARFVGASPTLNMVNQGLDTVFVVGDSSKAPALTAAGIHDLDVGTTAYDANTGTVRWKTTFDRGVGITDRIGAFEVNFHNNLIYEMVNSGNDIVTIERGVSDGEVSRSALYPGAAVRDSAISSVGGFLGVVGSKGSRFLALTYQTGSQTLELEAQPVAGRANSADISHTGSLTTTRTLLATGQSSGFGTGGDVYTVAYNYRTGSKLWERSWASAGNRADEGVVAEAAHVTALGTGVGFVAGRTFTPERGWDIIVTAHDLASGEALWSSPVTFDGEASDDDIPTHLVYSDQTSTLYLGGTSERGVPHGQDVLTLALDATTGTRKAVAYASGDSSNADDRPTGLQVSKDGRRVFVAADVHNLLGTGSRQAGLFGYDAKLRSAGSRLVGGTGDDRSAGVALNQAGSRAFLAGSSDSFTTGFDHRVTSYSVDGFTLPPTEMPTALNFTDASASSGQHTDAATIEARLTDESGAPLADQSVTFALAGERQTITTDAGGLARATYRLSSLPGTYSAEVDFAGKGDLLASRSTAPFEVTKEVSSITLAVTGKGSKRALSAHLVDSDSPDSGLAGRRVTFFADGVPIGESETAGDGSTRFPVPPGYRGGSYTFRVVFGGDDYFRGSEATTTS